LYQINISGDALDLQYEPLPKCPDCPFKSYDFLQPPSIDVNIFLPVALIINLIPGAGLNFLIDVLHAHA
jgi:hypothetical protein